MTTTTTPTTPSPPVGHAPPPPPPRAAARGSIPAAVWSLFVLTLRQHLHGRRWLVMGVLFLLPALLAVSIRAANPRAPLVMLDFLFAFLFIPQGLLPLVALLYASGMIQDEQEEQTITYLLIRPIPKWALYLTKLLATCTTTVVLTFVFTALLYVAVYARSGTAGQDIPLRCLKAASIHALAVVAYCCVFGLMSLLTRRTLIAGIGYMLIVEGVLANQPVSIRLVTVIYYARIIAYRSMSFVFADPRGPEDIAAKVWRLDVRADPTLAEHPQVLTCVVVLLAASLACALLAAFLCTRREFHVKTPEKN